jgi:hypothetical protein
MKKTSPARACAPLLTKPPPKKNPGKRNKWVWSMIPIPARKPKTDHNPFRITHRKTRTQKRNQKSNHNPFQMTNGKTVHTRDHCWSCHRCRDSKTSQVRIATHLSLSPHGGWLQQQPYCFAFCALLAAILRFLKRTPNWTKFALLFLPCFEISRFSDTLLMLSPSHTRSSSSWQAPKLYKRKNKRAHAHTLLSLSRSLAQRTGHHLSPLV